MKIFISYRRADSRDVVGRICDHLAREHGEQSVFVDVDSISPGDDFRETLDASMRDGYGHNRVKLDFLPPPASRRTTM